MPSLSVLVPAYNEEHLVATSLGRLAVLESSRILDRVQVVVVDDCSADATAEVLARFRRERGLVPVGRSVLDGVEVPVFRRPATRMEWIFLRHERNRGKGRAIQTALARAECEITIIHDADLEYHPRDILRIAQVFVDEGADAVFGSRFAGSEVRRVLMFRHELGNRLLTFLTNLVTNLNLTDMETCYKAVRTELLKSIPIRSNDFRLEPELAIKLAKREARLFEVPISYSGRTYQEGKKINWRDGFRALWAILRFALSAETYVPDAHGSHALARLGRAPRFNAWMADVVRPFVGARVLEIGSGTGTLTRQLVPRSRYVATDPNPLYLRALEAMSGDRPYLTAEACDVSDASTLPRIDGGFDTALALNVLEHVEDDRAALENLRSVLAPDGRVVVLVPAGEWNYGALDRSLGHRRRYTESSLRRVALDAGFEVRTMIPFNRGSSLPWWLLGKGLRRGRVRLFQMRILNLLTPLFRLVDRSLPLPPLSLVAVLERPLPTAAGAKEIDLGRERAATGEVP